MLLQPRPLVPFVLPKRSFRQPYPQRMLALHPLAFYKLDETSGTAIADSSGNNFGAVASNVSLATYTFLDGTTAPQFNGTDAFINIYSTAFAAAFNKQKGSLFIWARVLDAGTWTDGLTRGMFNVGANVGNRATMWKQTSGGAGRFNARYAANNSNLTDIEQTGLAGLDWHAYCMTWDTAVDQFRGYYDGALLATRTGLLTWTTAINSAWAGIGQFSTSAANLWKGGLKYAAVFDYALSPGQAADLAVV